ncbi:uncharacterized protein EV154DRAFT_554830 [Mucor mucedo]|uniref:uncharacterized protein n=1 Tax=Mucor mucedo TaxID=29922 RepID=UPI0022204921|nr:uncharacterized protein EV154DRAFT_554830 [Mucor mucedo]KAI7884712.1 hypothetical protein EV154DRAFT_554830 [Mucor mucedo]
MEKDNVDVIIKLNVGGTKHRTTFQTLMRLPYFKKCLGMGSWNDALQQDVVFIDRDGGLFNDILYFLRYNEVFTDDLEELCNEALFYQSKELVDVIEIMLAEKEDANKKEYMLMDFDEISALSNLSEYQEDVAIRPLYQNYDLIAAVSYRELQWGCVLHNKLLSECQRENHHDCDLRTQPAEIRQMYTFTDDIEGHILNAYLINMWCGLARQLLLSSNYIYTQTYYLLNIEF